MKKMLLATALALLITGCACVRRLLFKTNRSSSTKGNHHPSFLFLNWAEETVDAAKIGGAENVVKNRNPANIRKWIARFYYFRHLYSAEARVYCSQ